MGRRQQRPPLLNELRVYDRALSAPEVVSSYQAGANAVYAPPSVAPDSAVIQPGQKVLLDVLANDGGAPIPASLQVVSLPSAGSATVVGGRILYVHAGTAAAPVSFTYSVSNVSGATAEGAVTVSFAPGLRIDNPVVSMPPAPPPTFYQTVDALPGVSFSEPLAIATQPGNTRRLYVCERMAKIQLVPDVTAAAPAKNSSSTSSSPSPAASQPRPSITAPTTKTASSALPSIPSIRAMGISTPPTPPASTAWTTSASPASA